MLPPSVQRLLSLSLEEDLGRGDLTSEACIPATTRGAAHVVARERLRVCGADIAAAVFVAVDESIRCEALRGDGTLMAPGDVVMTVAGPSRSLLLAERTALNFLSRLCGIATHSARYAEVLHGLNVANRPRVVDTRKTTPGWRVLDKRAVVAGGLANHRMDLASGVMIKDNHIAACGSVTAAVEAVIQSPRVPHSVRIQVEVETAEQLDAALDAGADSLLIDNRSPAELTELVSRARAKAAALGRHVVVEASGGITLESLPRYAATGVDVISTGDLIRGAVGVDLALDWQS